jgi:NAD(P)-dependent dehydrogenase (short-subunit alcohol dehydrogenase family)
VSTYLENLFSLAGRGALVTGGSSGIGLAMARALAGAGARVCLLARTEQTLAAAAAELSAAGAHAHWVSADCGDEVSLLAGAAQAQQWLGEVDILVNAAAVNLRPALDRMGSQEWAHTVAVNLTAPFLLGQRFGPAMARRGFGRIINIGSQQQHSAFGNSGGYGAAKAGLAGLTRSQAEAWSSRGVTANTVVPGFVLTPLTAEAAADPDRVAALAARTMSGRNGVPADFAGIAVFLASTAADYVTGQALCVDGGFSVH